MRLRGPVATCPWEKEGLRLSLATACAAKQHEGDKQAFALHGKVQFLSHHHKSSGQKPKARKGRDRATLVSFICSRSVDLLSAHDNKE